MNKWIVTFLLFLGSLCAYAQENRLLIQPYQPGFSRGSVRVYLDDVEQKGKVALSFSGSSIDMEQEVQLPQKEYSVQAALDIILANQKVIIVERRNKILIVPAAEARRYVHESATYTVNGYIKETGSKEVLLGASVYIPDLHAGTVTNSAGFYSLTLPQGSYKMVCSYIGYKADTLNIQLNGNERMDVQLSAATRLQEVNIKSEKKPIQGYTQLSYEDINNKPMLLGENDVMRALQNEAGVQSGTEGSNDIYVRGGEPGHNLHLLDGVPLYYTNHFGLTSIYNADAIKSVDFHKGAFPARYAGRTSSIIEVNTKDGDMQRWGGQFTLGLLKATLNVEGPLIKDKASIMISGRRTWIDAFWRPFTNSLKLDFHDLNIKANYIVNPNNRLYVSFYTGRDQFGVNDDGASPDLSPYTYSTKSGNKILSAKWNTIIGPKLFVNTLVTYSQYRFNSRQEARVIVDTAEQIFFYRQKSNIDEMSVQVQGNWYMNRYHHIEAGTRYALTDFLPVISESEILLTGQQAANFGQAFRANEVDLYVEDNIKLSDKWMIRPGLHWSNWFSSGTGSLNSTSFNYSNLQPRFYVSYTPAPAHIVHASFTQMAQFLHSVGGGGLATNLISNNSNLNWNSESWVPSTGRVVPEEALMGTIGYTGKPITHLEYGIDLYYKDIEGIPTYDTRKYIYDNTIPWEEKILQGKGWSYGMELYAKQQIGPIRLSAAYTLSWTWRKYKELNEGLAFPYRYDRRHNIKIAAYYQPSRRFDASANWTYMSGEAITLPDQIYPDFDNNLQIDKGNTGFYYPLYNYSYTSLNNYRLPSIHRLDVAMNFHKKLRRNMVRTWSFGMFNAYGHTNIMYVNLENTLDGVKLTGNGFLKFIPFASYKLKF